jgi:hypothetical protein
MSQSGWGVPSVPHSRLRPQVTLTAFWLVVAVTFLGACAPDSGPSATPAPTITLIPATTTPTLTPTVPTPTVPPRINPNDLLQTPTPIPAAPSTEDDLDPVAAELLLLARQRVMALADIADPFVIEVALIRAYRWPDGGLGCPLPELEYPPGEVEGYRIVLAVADETYIFHTSFTDLVRCDPANVTLPDVSTSNDFSN